MTSVSGFAANKFVLQQNLEAENRVQEQRIQVSTGKKSQTFDGISDNVRRLEGLESDFAANEAFQRNVDRTELRLQEMESSVSTLNDTASRFRTQLLSAANDGGNLESIDLGKIASTFRDEVVGQLNTEVGGRFLFSGSATNTTPIDLTSASGFSDIKNGAYFKGNGEELTARVTQSTTLDYGISAEPGKGKGFQKLMTALSRVIENPESPDAVEKSLRDLSGGEAQAVVSFDSVKNPSAALNASENFGSGLSFSAPPPAAEEFSITIGGSTTDLTSAPTSIAEGDSLIDIAGKIENNVSGVEAQVGGKNDTPRLEVFTTNGAPVSFTTNFSGGGTQPRQQTDVQIDGAINELADTRSEIGSSRGLLESTKTQLENTQTRLEGNISDVEDVNLTRAMTLLAQNQTTLQSSFAVTARLSQVSLLNFLR